MLVLLLLENIKLSLFGFFIYESALITGFNNS